MLYIRFLPEIPHSNSRNKPLTKIKWAPILSPRNSPGQFTAVPPQPANYASVAPQNQLPQQVQMMPSAPASSNGVGQPPPDSPPPAPPPSPAPVPQGAQSSQLTSPASAIVGSSALGVISPAVTSGVAGATSPLSITQVPITAVAATSAPGVMSVVEPSGEYTMMTGVTSPSSTLVPVMPTDFNATSPAALNAKFMHSAPFYVGILLGSIFIIAILASLVAWWFRLHKHSKQRKLASEALDIPWAQDKGSRVDALTRHRRFDIDGSMDDLHAWDLRGDRDVGPPKRSQTYWAAKKADCRCAPKKQTSLPYDNLAYHNVTAAQYPQPVYDPTSVTQAGSYESHRYMSQPMSSEPSLSVDDHSSSRTLGPLQVANMLPGDVPSASSSRATSALGSYSDELLPPPGPISEFGTPREHIPGSRPRFLSVQGQGLRVPWTSTRPAPEAAGDRGVNNAKKRVRNLTSGPGRAGCQRPLPTPIDERKGAFGVDALRTSVAYALNHATGIVMPERGECDKLVFYRESRTSGSGSPSKRRRGAGAPPESLMSYRGADHALSPVQGHRLPSQCGSKREISGHVNTARGPLDRFNSGVQLRPDTFSQNSQLGRRFMNLSMSSDAESVSRASSVYSAASATSSVAYAKGVIHPIGKGSINLTPARERAFESPATQLRNEQALQHPWNQKERDRMSMMSRLSSEFSLSYLSDRSSSSGDVIKRESQDVIRTALVDRRRKSLVALGESRAHDPPSRA